MKQWVCLIGLVAMVGVHLHALEVPPISQFGLSTPSVGWANKAGEELLGHHGLTVVPGLSLHGIGVTLGWASTHYVPEYKTDRVIPYWHWGVNVLYGIYPVIGVGAEYKVNDTQFISLQTVNLDGVILGLMVRP
ncbi:MAG: hypothetical protein ISQ13_00095 [Candidatus Margulisbacteria bacterium]|nr:hypothetical protein [Candidatus Margulisiibacteriota bacterium]